MLKLIDLVHGSGGAMLSVYVLDAGAGVVKIGVSNDVAGRVRTIQTGHHKAVRVAWAVDLARKDARFVEKSAHARLATSRLEGEWFCVGVQNAIGTIKGLIEQNRLRSLPNLQFGRECAA